MNTPKMNRENNVPVTCPYCGQEMDDGEVMSNGPCALYWLPSDPELRALAFRGGRGLLKSVVSRNLVQISIKGNYCHTCRKLIIPTEIQP
ncbi:MAG: hypothetical protein IJK71_03630 [Clostridia bacterium]|nr:hypothetical protein [Clostridia bacterium]